MANAKNQTVGRMSPRQKMINLMYIVLTAMLALNVSSAQWVPPSATGALAHQSHTHRAQPDDV